MYIDKDMETTYDVFVDQMQIPDVNQRALDFALSRYKGDPQRLILEFGVSSGHTITSIANTFAPATIYGFDSFEGLPSIWERHNDGSFAKGAFDMGGEFPIVPPNVRLVKGWFNESLPIFIQEHRDEKVTFLHIDCDLYESTKCVLDLLLEHDMLADDVVIVFDELVNYSTYREHELKAFYEFLQKSSYIVKWQGMLGAVNKGHDVLDTGAQFQSVACTIHRNTVHHSRTP